MSYLQQFTKTLPTLLTAFILAVAVWISAETSNNPTEEANFPQPVPLEVVGQDPGLVITSSMPSSVVLTIRAPQSVWQALRANPGLVRAVLDLSGLETGTHTVQVQIQVGRSPYEIVNHSPRSVNVTLERLISRTLPIDLVVRGEPAIGYQAETPELSHDTVIVSGPETLVNQVQSVRALLDLSGATEPITRNITLQALDSSETVVNGISITPDRITAAVEVAQRFGYRNVVVKAEVIGQIANGYRLTNISVFPPAVTVYSPNPQIISSLPGVISTLPVDLTGVQDDIDISVALDLPPGVLVVGDENEVLVRVGVAAIESSLTLDNMPVEVAGLPANLAAVVAPETVTVIFSGPVALLDQLNRENIRVYVEIDEPRVGTFQATPQVEVVIRDVVVQSVIPNSVEVVISQATAATPSSNR